MSMFRIIAIVLCSVAIVPVGIYLVAKFATLGYYSGKEQWERLSVPDIDDNESTQNKE